MKYSDFLLKLGDAGKIVFVCMETRTVVLSGDSVRREVFSLCMVLVSVVKGTFSEKSPLQAFLQYRAWM